MLILMLLTGADVILRYLFNTAIPDLVELSSFLLAILISLAFAHTTYEGNHVEVTLLIQNLSRRLRFALEAITWSIGAVVLIIMTWWAFDKAFYSLRIGEFLGGMRVPVYPAKFVFAFSCSLTALAMMIRVYEAVGHLIEEKRKR
jgi:TRAP-type C4-dicarboxylate transport system permease small subunit